MIGLLTYKAHVRTCVGSTRIISSHNGQVENVTTKNSKWRGEVCSLDYVRIWQNPAECSWLPDQYLVTNWLNHRLSPYTLWLNKSYILIDEC